MFSVQIDTARSWRGGQNQVLLTTIGLRQLGHRVVLVAHPDGELRRRLGENGSACVKSCFNPDRLASEYLGVLQNAVN